MPENDAKPRLLMAARLSIKSSYAQNVEIPAASYFDTVQFWFEPDRMWRIRTYAIDKDIHIYEIEYVPDEPEAFAAGHFQRAYGDVLDSTVSLLLEDLTDEEHLSQLLRERELPGHIELSPSGFGFWNPDGRRYHTQTRPDDF